MPKGHAYRMDSRDWNEAAASLYRNEPSCRFCKQPLEPLRKKAECNHSACFIWMSRRAW
ncbi:hypothetical protein HMPREF1141_2100 [Clostridium sp. MSTE9]|nr:hypothetical protein HMPREF1141_2100 [Clostridium sp. MSTE9]